MQITQYIACDPEGNEHHSVEIEFCGQKVSVPAKNAEFATRMAYELATVFQKRNDGSFEVTVTTD